MGPADLGDGAAAPIVLSGVSVPTAQSDLIVASALIALTVLMENSGLAGVSEPLVAAPVSIVLTAASDRATAAAVPGRNVLIVVSASLALARHAVMVSAVTASGAMVALCVALLLLVRARRARSGLIAMSAVTMNLPLLKVLPVLKSMI
jgi:hypothetical protein